MSSREEKKTLRLERKRSKKDASILEEIKPIWEKLRQNKLSDEDRKKSMSLLMKVITGKVSDLVFKHDSSRVIQTVIKFGSTEERTQIGLELMNSMLELSKSVYGKFIVMKLLKYCPKLRSKIIEKFYGRVIKCLKHKECAVVIEEIYSLYANASQKAGFVEEFYGSEFSVFKRLDRNLNLKNLLEKEPSKKPMIMKNLHESLMTFLDKGTIRYSLVHRLMLEYVDLADRQQLEEFLGIFKEHLVEVVHTKDGHVVAIKCLSISSAKDRKIILKSFKPFLEKIYLDEYGHLVVIAALSMVDDTVLLQKTILQELLGNLEKYSQDKHSMEIIIFLLTGKVSTKYMNQYAVAILSDPQLMTESKKDPVVRAKELLEFCREKVIESLWKKDLLFDGRESVISEIVNSMIFPEALEDIISWIGNDRNILIEKASSGLIRRLVSNDDFSMKLARLFSSSKEWLEFLTTTEAIRILLAIVKKGLMKDDPLKSFQIPKVEALEKLQELLHVSMQQ